ncbi:MAG TPA: GNAT family N-acetyltransferase [Longilinea sp.]|nr:GNAT family N-acetyltransferase [Longilinea sp.]
MGEEIVDVVYSQFSMADHSEAMDIWQRTPGIGITKSDGAQETLFFLERNPGLSWAARVDGELVGTILCGHDGRRGFIYHLAVKKEFRHQGIGRTLVERAIDGLKAIGIPRCHIFVYADNKHGAEFWKEMGWRFRLELNLMSRNL